MPVFLEGTLQNRSAGIAAHQGHENIALSLQGQHHMADILQLLKVVIRGVGLVGDSNESAFIEGVKNRLEIFAHLTHSLHESDLVNQLKESTDSAIKQLMAKSDV